MKDRPFAEGSRGCHALLWLDAQNLNAKEHHFILPLVIKNFIMQSVAFISSISQVRIKFIFFVLIDHTYLESNFLLLASMTTYLKDLIQSIGRYGGLSWQNWVKGCLEAQVVSLLGAKSLASMRGKGKLNMLEDPRHYNFYSDIRKNNPLCCLPCPTSTF